MASKKFAYYNKGNKIALIQKNNNEAYCSLSGYENKTDCENAGGTWYSAGSFAGDSSTYGKYKSPNSTIEKGLEVEYTYAPIYNLQSTGTEGTDFHRFIGWGSDGVNLLLFTFGSAAVADLSSLFAADDWILIKGSGRWSGLHQVKSTGGSTGILTLKTRCNIAAAKLSTTVNFTTSETITGQTAAHKMDIEAYKDATSSRSKRYIFIDLADKPVNSGLFSLLSNTTSGVLTSNKRIVIDADGDYTEENAAMEVETSTNDAIVIYNVFYEQLSVYEGVEVMQDETFELDLTRYQANAVILYMRSKLAEEMGNIELYEYYTAKFTKQLEKASGSRKYGPHIVQGHGMTRK